MSPSVTGVGIALGSGRCARDGGRLANADDELADLVDRGQLADGRNGDPLAVGIQLAGRNRQVVGLQDAEHLLLADAGLGHRGRIESDEDLRLETAGQVDRGDAADSLDRGTISLVGDLRGLVEALLAGRRDGGDDDRRGVDVERLDRRVDRLGQPESGDVLLDLGLRGLDVRAELELSDYQRDRVGRGRLDLGEVGRALDGSLDRLGDLRGDVGRARAGVRRDDGDDREVDVRQQLLLERSPGRQAGDEEGERQQDDDAAMVDGETREPAHG